MTIRTNWIDRIRSRLTGLPPHTFAARRTARTDLHTLNHQRALAVARLHEDIELFDRYVNPLERYLDGGRLLTPLGTILDRRSGKNLPLVWTELDLREFRRWARLLCDINPFAIGFLALLTDFHIRQGFGWQTYSNAITHPLSSHTSTQDEQRKVLCCQLILDQWRDQQLWPLKSREAFRRWRRDGEVFLRFFRGDRDTHGLPAIRFVEPEQVGPPPGDDADGRWSFGILTDPDDVQTVHAYFVRDPLGTGSEGDEVPVHRILHLKANVDSSIKRGLPDFLPVQDDLERVRRILRNMGEVAAIQTAIAWVSQYATATADQVGTLIRAGSDYTRPKIADPSGKLMDVVSYEPGTVLHMDSNRQFLAGPVGTGTPGFVQVEQAILRGCGARWRFPEYFSGDASNNNMASSIVAGSPFVVAVEGNQLEWGVFERAVAKKVLELCVESGRLSRDQIAGVDVKVTPPAVALANREEEERLRQMRNQAGVLSVTTWQQQVGLDPQHEAANFDAEARRKAQQQAKSSGSPRMEGRLQEGPPGPPPRPGLVWKDSTHRWIRPETGEEFHHDGTPVDASATASPPGAKAASPDHPENIRIRDLNEFLKKSPEEQRAEIIKHVLPEGWEKGAVRTNDNETANTKKIRAMTDHLSTLSSQDLYALMRHYGTQKAESAVKSWATTANEVLLDRMLKDLGSQLNQQKGWDATVDHLGAVVNYKLITSPGSTNDNFTKADAQKVLTELKSSDQHGMKPFARITIMARPPVAGMPHPDNGVYIYPDFGSATYQAKQRPRSNNPEGWPIRIMTGTEFEKGLANPGELAHELSEKVDNKFGKTGSGSEVQKKARDAMMKSKRVATNETLESSGKALSQERTESPERSKELTEKLIGGIGNDPATLQEVANQAIDKLTDSTALQEVANQAIDKLTDEEFEQLMARRKAQKAAPPSQ